VLSFDSAPRTRSTSNMALKPTSRIGAILGVWMRLTALSIFKHLRLAGLAQAFGGSMTSRL
jgi:hypothetical protein